MIETLLLELIKQLNGSVFVLIVVLIVLFILVYKSGGMVNSFKNFQSKHESFDTKIDSIKDSLASIKATTDLLYQTHVQTVKAHSPLSLTEIGHKISRELKIMEMIDDHWAEIELQIAKKSPTNPYDIQTVAMDIARACFENLFSNDEKNNIKTYAYNTGMNLLQIYPVIGIEIRNKYFKKNGIKIDDVDKHQPKNKVSN